MILDFVRFIPEKIDRGRDKILFTFIKRFWPRAITPNQLSVLRIFIGIFLALLLFSGFEDKFWIIALFCFGLLLDLFDGSVARCLKMKSKTGKVLDPVADRVLIFPIVFYVLAHYYLWLLLVILIPEMVSSLNAIYYKKKKKKTMEANIFGKTKMVIQSFSFGVILLRWPSPPSHIIISLLIFSFIFSLFNIYTQVKYTMIKTKESYVKNI